MRADVLWSCNRLLRTHNQGTRFLDVVYTIDNVHTVLSSVALYILVLLPSSCLRSLVIFPRFHRVFTTAYMVRPVVVLEYCVFRALGALKAKSLRQLQKDWTEASQPLCCLVSMAYKSSEPLLEVMICIAIRWQRR